VAKNTAAKGAGRNEQYGDVGAVNGIVINLDRKPG